MNKRILIARPSIDNQDDFTKKIIEEEEDEEEFSEDLPSFKSVILNPNAQPKENLFYDQKQSRWVELDNFAFRNELTLCQITTTTLYTYVHQFHS